MKEVKFEIQGVEVTINENDVVADALENNDEFAMQYFERAVREGKLINFGIHAQETDHLSVVRTTQTLDLEIDSLEDSRELAEHSSGSLTNAEIWSSKGKPSEEDILATTSLLSLRGSDKYKKSFSDKKNPKNKLWKNIANKMNEDGFAVTAVKCQQKYLNLVKSYTKHVRHLHQTGQEKRVPPPFYEEMHNILGSKDKITLLDRVDTLEIPSCSRELPLIDSACTNREDNVQEDENVENLIDNVETQPKVSKRKPCVTKAEVLNTIVDCNNKILENQNKSFDKMFSFLSKQNELIAHQNTQRDQLINILQQSLQLKSKKTKKRRRSSSSSSS